MLPQPKTIDSFIAMLSNEAARPVTFRAKLSARHDADASALERFDAQPLESDLDQVLTAQSDKLAVAATLESFDRFTVESRGQALADAAARTHKDTGKRLLEAELAERSKNRMAKHAALGKVAAADQVALLNPDLPPTEFDMLEAHRAGLVGQSEALEYCFSVSKSAIERFFNGPTAETWGDAVRAVRAVDFS